MWDLSKHERLEVELLEGLNSRKVLDHLIFCGGTMLRLCHELNRYSVDLDFWLLNKEYTANIFKETKKYLAENYRLKKAANRKEGLVFEFAARGYPRSLKIEIRKQKAKIRHEGKIAFSKHNPIQIMVKAATLDEMMKAKVETFLDRVQIRDVFDIEFLLKRGVKIIASRKELLEIQKLITKFKTKDYKVALGSLLDFKERQYYKQANFRFLLNHINAILQKES